MVRTPRHCVAGGGCVMSKLRFGGCEEPNEESLPHLRSGCHERNRSSSHSGESTILRPDWYLESSLTRYFTAWGAGQPERKRFRTGRRPVFAQSSGYRRTAIHLARTSPPGNAVPGRFPQSSLTTHHSPLTTHHSSLTTLHSHQSISSGSTSTIHWTPSGGFRSAVAWRTAWRSLSPSGLWT